MKEDNVSISSTLEDMLDIFSSIVVTSLSSYNELSTIWVSALIYVSRFSLLFVLASSLIIA